MNALVLIEEKDCEGGGINQLLNLILAEIAEEAGFLVEAMGFIYDESAEAVGGCIGEGPGADEEIGDARFFQGAGEFCLVDGTRCAVLGDIFCCEIAVG